MTRIEPVTRAARSGKSHVARARTLRFASRATCIATAETHEPEMADRIAAHPARRGPEWLTALALAATHGAPRLADCLRLWPTNRMLADADLPAETDSLVSARAAVGSLGVLVTIEVGCGIVRGNALTRRFRDAAGILNQCVAGVADEIWPAACGLPLSLKKQRET